MCTEIFFHNLQVFENYLVDVMIPNTAAIDSSEPPTSTSNVFNVTCLLESLQNSNQLTGSPMVQKPQVVTLDIWDTGGASEYDRLRAQPYADAGVLLLCFSLAGASSLDSLALRVRVLRLTRSSLTGGYS